MSPFRRKVLVALLAAGVMPVAVAGALSWRANREELVGTVRALHTQTSLDLARQVGSSVLQTVENLQTAVGYLRLAELPPADAEAVLQIPLRQFRNLTAVALVDASGKPITRVIGRAGAPPDDGLIRAFGAHAPLKEAMASGVAVGVPYRVGEGAHVAIAVDVGEQRAQFLLADVSLAELEERLRSIGRDEVAYIVDGQGQVVVHSDPSLEDTSQFLLAEAPVTELGWRAVTGRRAAVALRPAERLARYTVFWTLVAVALTVVVSVGLSRGVSEPLRALVGAARDIAQGRYEQRRIAIEGNDEFGELARTFEHMSSRIAERDAEIRRWGEELQQRVDERTRELKEAQEQIQRSRRLASVGTLAAGFAHELNNPLTGVVGLLGLLKKDVERTPAAELVDMALEEASRMTRVINDVRRMAERERNALGAPVPLDRSVTAALESRRAELAQRNIRVSAELQPGMPPVLGDPEQLRQVVEQLIQNAATAMPKGGELRVELGTIGGDALRLSVQDTGKGIPEQIRDRIFDPFFTTKDEPGRTGMGLTLAARIVDAHHGRITLQTELGKGSTFNVILPAAGARAHLY